MYNIWDLDIKQKRLTKNKKLQPIIPFVVYANDKEWTRENTLSYLLDTIPDPVKKHVPDYEYLMLNLQVKDFDEIKGELLTQIMLKTMKIVFMNDVDLEERLREILHLIKLYKNVENTQETLEVFRLFIRYLTRAAKYIKKEQLEKSVQKELPEWRSDYMTIADVLRKEGIEKGKEETAVNLYKMGLTLDQIAKGTGIDKEKLKEILKDVER
jgi:predicted transposase/invertase (TIGR01784 family)